MTFVIADAVYDTTTGTGTGPFTVNNVPPSGYRSFNAVCVVGDTLPYRIRHLTANEWQEGMATYSASNQLTLTTCESSSNSNSPVTFSAGTKEIYLAVTAAWFNQKRIIQTTDLDLYVNPSTGSDSNPGTLALPFATFQYAATAIATRYDYRNVQPTLHLAAGTYHEEVLLGAWDGTTTSGFITIVGDEANPHLYILDGHDIAVERATLRVNNPGANWNLTGFMIYGGQGCLRTEFQSSVIYGVIALKFGDQTGYGMWARDGSSIVRTKLTGGNPEIHIYNDNPANTPQWVVLANRGGAFMDASSSDVTFHDDITFNGFALCGSVASLNAVDPGVTITNPSNFHGDFLNIFDWGVFYAAGGVITTANKTPQSVVANSIIQDAVTGQMSFHPTTVRSSSDFTKTTDTALAAAFSHDVFAGFVYEFHARLFVNPDSTGGHKYAMGGSCTASAVRYQITSIRNDTGAIVCSVTQSSLGGTGSAAGCTSIYTEIHGTIAVSADGTLELQFAQNASSGSSKVLAQSQFDVKIVEIPF